MTGKADPRRAAAAFCRDGDSCRVWPLGRGNINDTFLVSSAAGPFVLQRINRQVFPEPLRVINNFAKITGHLNERQKLSDNRFRTARPVLTLTGALFFRDSEGEYWRGQTYLAHTSCQVVANQGQAFQIGQTLARFHFLVADLNILSFEDPLPGFHNLSRYLQEYDRLPTKTAQEASAAESYCFAHIDGMRIRATILEDAKRAGILTVQAIHGDPKIDNFLFDHQGLADGMLDLDTVGAGIVHYDLGDCLRSCCNRGGESGTDGMKVTFDTEICRAILAGYFSLPQPLLSAGQCAYVFDGVLAITFELGLRFFTDHLRGNIYFKVRYNGENLVRAERQFRLAEDIVGQEEDLRRLVCTSEKGAIGEFRPGERNHG
jgi:Ser/Thr protein kinase RdoA (MazF antagonist)